MIKIRVPATSANLGAGFDCLGVALSLFNEFEVFPSSSYHVSGVPIEFANENNMFLRAYKSTFHENDIPITVTFNSSIPISRGLGSSSSLIIGGLIAGMLMQNKPLRKEDILSRAIVMEGHPDNVTPALLGGLVASYQDFYQRIPIHEDYHFTLFMPEEKVSTTKARSILPDSYPRDVAVRNSAKAILTVEALRRFNMPLLQNVAKDEFHEPYRKTLIPHFDEVKEYLDSLNHGVFLISGSGSTCLYISDQSLTENELEDLEKMVPWTIKEVKVSEQGACLWEKDLWAAVF